MVFSNHQKKIKKITQQFPQKYEAAQLFSKFLIIQTNLWAVNLHIRIHFELSCDSKDSTMYNVKILQNIPAFTVSFIK